MPRTILVTRIFPRSYEISNCWCYMGQMTDTVRNFPNSPSVKAPYALSIASWASYLWMWNLARVKLSYCLVHIMKCKATSMYISGCWPEGTSLRRITEYVQPWGALLGSHPLSFLGMFTNLAQSMFSDVSWKLFLKNCVGTFQVTAVSAGMINAYLHPISWVEDFPRFEFLARPLLICSWLRSVLF